MFADRTDDSDSQPTSRGAADTTGGGAGDAVAEARRWLTQRGIAVPDEVPEDGREAKNVPREPTVPPDEAGDDVGSTRPELGEPARARRTGFSGPADDGPDADPESVARTIVLRKLSVQARTRHELQRALEAKAVPAEAATTVLDRMEALGLIDDPTFARDWIESRQRRRYLSKSALRRELSNKGIDRDEIESALEAVDGDDELAAARALTDKKMRSMAALTPLVRQRRLAGVLGRRGFSAAVIGRVLDEALDGQGS